MKVYNLSTRKVEEYNDGYAARLIEQGKAILPQEKAAPKEAEKPGKAATGADSVAKGKATSTGGK